MPAVSSKLQITPAECRLHAAECQKIARHARRPHVRGTLAEIECMWNTGRWGRGELSVGEQSLTDAAPLRPVYSPAEVEGLASYFSFSAMLRCSFRWGSVCDAQFLRSALSPF